MRMADEEFDDDSEFDEELAPDDLDVEELDEGLDEEGFADEDELVVGDDLVEEEGEEDLDLVPSRHVSRAADEEEDEDEDLVTPDDVEADLDTILKDRLASSDETDDEDEGQVEVDDRGDTVDRLQPKRPDEQHCPKCFLLVRRTAPACPMDDDDCPLFT
jgi:hypothetical protein